MFIKMGRDNVFWQKRNLGQGKGHANMDTQAHDRVTPYLVPVWSC